MSTRGTVTSTRWQDWKSQTLCSHVDTDLIIVQGLKNLYENSRSQLKGLSTPQVSVLPRTVGWTINHLILSAITLTQKQHSPPDHEKIPILWLLPWETKRKSRNYAPNRSFSGSILRNSFYLPSLKTLTGNQGSLRIKQTSAVFAAAPESL